MFSDLFLFYRIIKNEIKIELTFYMSKYESQDVKNVARNSQPIKYGMDDLQYKSKLN